MQLKLMEQSTEPCDFKLSLNGMPSILTLNEQLIHLALERKLDGRTLGAINGTVTNTIRIHQPQPGTQVNVTQQVAVDPEQIVTGFLNTLPSELRNAIVAYGRKQAKLEQVTATH